MNSETHIEPSKVIKWYDRTYLRKVIYGEVIEDYIGNDMPLREIAKKYTISESHASRIVSMYFKKPERSLTLTSKV